MNWRILGTLLALGCGLRLLGAGSTLVLSADGLTVYDSANGVTWLADANLAASNRFGLPVCTNAGNGGPTCVDSGGAMNFTAATAWVAAMNEANYLGHSNWQLPTIPLNDSHCGKTGPTGNSFGFGCTVGALDSLYNTLGFQSPNTAVPIPANTAGPFSNLQPYLYWSSTNGSSPQQGNASFSFATGWQGANTLPNFLYLLPMIPGKLPGTPAASGTGLQVNPGGQTVYDPMTNITWLANANLPASNTFGLPLCTSPTNPALCVAQDGAMTFASATQFLANMNAAAYLGQTKWQAPTIDTSCPGFACDGTLNPMGNLFYDQLGFKKGISAVATPTTPVGPFHNLQPYLYWSCVANAIAAPCESAGPADNFEESYSFGAGFQGTDVLGNNLFVTAYFVGSRASTAPPVITLVANAEGETPTIAPNTWVEIKGTDLAPAGDIRPWQTSDFVGDQMPIALDGISVTVNHKAAYVYYVSPTQINVLTPPDAMTGTVPVVVNVNGSLSAAYNATAQATSPSFFVINGGPYVLAQHAADYSLVGPASLYAALTTPAKPLETVVFYANGFGPTTQALVPGSRFQSGDLSPFPIVTIGGLQATVGYAALILPGLYQINVTVPANAPSGDNLVAATIGGVSTSPTFLLNVQSAAPSTSANFYVAPNGSDGWSGALASPNPAGTDGPFASFDRARAAVAAVKKTGLTQVTVQFRGGTYYLPATVQFSAADSGTANTPIVYTNYATESPVFSGGMRLSGWTNTSGNTWKMTLPGPTQYFENLFYNGVRRLRPRLGGALGTFYRIAGTVYLPASATNCTVNVAGSGYECFDRFQYNPSDPIAATWKNYVASPNNLCHQTGGNQAVAGDIEVLDFEQFSTSKLRISCIDTVNHIVYLTGPTPISQNNPTQVGFIAGNRYLVDNVQDALTQPGQWFLDRSATPMTITYLANTGENPNSDLVVAPQLTQLVVASGLQYVTFHGLTFEHDNYVVPAAGHKSSENEVDIPGALSFQNAQHITFDGGTVTQISGTGLEFIPCVSAGSPDYCVSNSGNGVTANDVVENSAFYDVGVMGIRIGDPYIPAFNDANVPQFITVQNNVVEGYGRIIPASFGIGQGQGHDNLYMHNDVYDGYHCAISITDQAPDNIKPAGMGNANNTISFNHVWNLLQGIMNDGGSIRIEAGNNAYTAPGNKILNNRIHDVTDASIQDSNGYGGNGIYMDNQTGLVDVENNLVYRVSGNNIYTPQGPAAPNEANIIKNNILANGRSGMVGITDPYPYGVPAVANRAFELTNNLFYFDLSTSSSPKFYVQDGCTYSGGFSFTQFEQWNNNLYWRTDGSFATDSKAFHVQANAVATGGNAPCSGLPAQWTFYSFAGWQTTFAEDLQSVVKNPGFNNPGYPNDDFTMPKGSPFVGFVVFDYSQAGRSNAVIHPPAIPATFPTMYYNPATDY